MAKITYDYDKGRNVLYFYEGKVARTVNIPINGDILLRVDPKRRMAVGFTITNFSSRFPKLIKLVKTKNEEFLATFFELYLQEINEIKETMSQEKPLRQFMLGQRVSKGLVPA